MATRTNRTDRSQRSHDRRALVQWIALGLVAVLGLIAAFTLTDGSGGGGGHVNAPVFDSGI